MPSAKASMATATEFEGLLIAGGGIAGLATALALHRVGIRSIVLEQAECLRTTGAAIALWTNAWKALTVLGIADHVRQQHQPLQGAEMVSHTAGTTRYFPFQGSGSSRTQEVRTVKRALLLEVLAKALPPETIKFNCKIVRVRQSLPSKLPAEAELDDGTILRAKGVIACDGVNSVVAHRILGFPTPNFYARCIVQGLASYPEGHQLRPNLHFHFLHDVAFWHAPLNDRDVQWIVACASTPSDYSKIAHDRLLVHRWAETLLRDFPEESLQVITRTASDSESLNMAVLRFRWPWSFLTGTLWKGTVTAAGDAMHPMPPDIGQAGCSALEDAVVLARCLAEMDAINDEPGHDNGEEARHIAAAFRRYADERKWRWISLVSQAHIIGFIYQGSSAFARFIRDKVLFRVVPPKIMSSHADYDCGALPIISGS